MTHKQRYLIRHYHNLFGYYTGFSLSTKPEPQQDVAGLAPAVYGRPDLVTTKTIAALPIAWDGDDARTLYERGAEFAYLSLGDKGKVLAGWVEAEDYQKHEEWGMTPAWAKALSLRDYLKAGCPAYIRPEVKPTDQPAS